MLLKITRLLEFPSGPAVKDQALSLMWLRFDPRPRNFCLPRVWPKQNKPFWGDTIPFFTEALPYYILINTAQEFQ